MIEVKKGDILVDIKMGTSAKGRWGFANANAEKGKDRITIWFNNANEIPEDTCAIEIGEITSASLTVKKVGENWFKNFNLNATVIPAAGGAKPIDEDALGEVPF